MSTYLFWTTGSGYNRFDLYGFLQDDFFDTYSNNSLALALREFPPHELYCFDNFKLINGIRGCGKKRTATVVDIIERYRRGNPKNFCECGEPYLHWYEFCPACGKERKA